MASTTAYSARSTSAEEHDGEDEIDSESISEPGRDDYSWRSEKLQADARAAWDAATPEWRGKAAALGMKPPIDDPKIRRESSLFVQANELDDKTKPCAAPPIEDLLDTWLDRLIEEFGTGNKLVIVGVIEKMIEPIKESLDRDRAQMISTIVGVLARCQASNIMARIHQLMHAIPRLALLNGFSSMNKSAQACNVSREWVRRGRDEWCLKLGLSIPAEGRKSIKAKTLASTAHWRAKKAAAPGGYIRNKTAKATGLATIHGVSGEFDIWLTRMGGLDGLKLMDDRAKGDIKRMLGKMAAVHDVIG